MADFPSLFEFIDNKLSVSDLIFLSGIQCSCAVPVCTSWTYSTPLWTSSRNVPAQTPGLSRVSCGCWFSEGFPNKTGFAESQHWCSCQCFILESLLQQMPPDVLPGWGQHHKGALKDPQYSWLCYCLKDIQGRFVSLNCHDSPMGLSLPWFLSAFHLGALDFCPRWGFTVISLPEVVAFPCGWGDPWVCVQVPLCCCVTVNMSSVLL